MLPPMSDCSPAPMLPTMLRDRTTMPRTIPRFLTMRYPGSWLPVVSIDASKRLIDHPGAPGLLRTTEQPAVHGLREHVALHRFHDVRAGLERVRRRLDGDRRVERVQFEHVMMLRTVRAGAGAAVDLTRRADLISAVRKFRAFRLPFGQSSRRRRNGPDHPVRLIVGRLVAPGVHVAPLS